MGLRVGNRDWVAAVLLIAGIPLFVGITFVLQRRTRRSSDAIAKLQEDMRVLSSRLEVLEKASNADRTELPLSDRLTCSHRARRGNMAV